MTWAEFSEIFATLALQLRATDADEAMARSYFKLLDKHDVELVALAAQRFAERGGPDGSAWFPRTPEWIDAINGIALERRHHLERVIYTRRMLNLPPLCAECDDTGFASTGDNAVRKCGCQDMRRLEQIGRRPLPLLPAKADVTVPDEPPARVLALVKPLADAKGMP